MTFDLSFCIAVDMCTYVAVVFKCELNHLFIKGGGM